MLPNDDSDEIDDQVDDVLGSAPGSAASKTPPGAPQVSFAKARKRLIERYGYRSDELDALFKTEESLLEFYNKTIRQGLNKVETKALEAQLGWDSEDDFDISDEEKKRILAAKDTAAIEAFKKRDQSKLPKEAQVTPEELNEARNEVNKLLADIDDI